MKRRILHDFLTAKAKYACNAAFGWKFPMVVSPWQAADASSIKLASLADPAADPLLLGFRRA